jgi:hypothetical protein
MKKVILSLALVAGISATASAQATFGIKAGGSYTNFTGKDVGESASKFGGHGGLLANFGFGDALSVQPEILFSMKGSQDKDDSKNQLNMNYIDIPVLLKYNADGLFFEAGPQLGILVSAKATDGTNTLDVKEFSNTTDFGYAVGLGYMVESGPMIGLRYNGGLSNVVKEQGGVNTDFKNSAFQLYVGYMFGGK